MLTLDPVAELFHATDQCAIAQREQVEIFVAGHELAERTRREHCLGRVQWTAFVNVDEPAMQGASLGVELALRRRDLPRGPGHLVGDRRQLSVERLDDTRRGLGPAIQVRDFFVQVVHRVLQLGGAPFEHLSLVPDALQRITLCPEARGLVLGVERRPRNDERQRRHRDGEGAADGGRHTWRRCRPTETALPMNPMSAPNMTPSIARRRSKNAVWKCRYWSSTRMAMYVSTSAISPPSTPLIEPSMRKGRRMKPSVAPTRRMIEISRLRANTAMRIVAPMMITATAANARPSAMPATPAMLRSRQTCLMHSSPYRTSSTKSYSRT